MRFSIARTRAAAHITTCAVALCATVAHAQQAAEPAQTPAELPPLEVTAKSAQKKSATKKSTAKAAPKAAPQPVAADSQNEQRPAGVTNGLPAVKDYVATDATTGTKTDTPLRETPQSISVVGKEQMRDQGVQNLQEAFRYVPGVVADPWGYDSRYDSTTIRGITGTFFVDGLRSTYGYGYTTSMIEPYSLERVEVLRGPASMLYGQTPAGGIINAISKLPSEIPYTEVGVEYGSFDFKQVKLDSTGALTKDGKWLYRIVGLAREADTQVDFVDNDRLMLAPSITYRPTNDTSITFLGNLRKDQSGSTLQFGPQEGVLFPNTVTGQRLSRSTFLGEPTDHYDTDAQSATIIFDHKFSDDLKIHHTSRYAHTETEYDSTYGVVMTPARVDVINGLLGGSGLNPAYAPFLNADHTEIARSRTLSFNDTDVFNTDTNLTGKFSTGWIDHKVTGGIDYMRFATDQVTSGTLVDNIFTASSLDPAAVPIVQFLSFMQGFGGALQPAFNMYNPRYGRSNYLVSLGGTLVSPDDLPLEARPHEVQSQTGLYIQDQLKMGPWIAVLGLRQDWVVAEQAGSPSEKHDATTGRAALMYNFDFGLTPYVSYSTSFAPLPGQPVGDHVYASAMGGQAALRPAGPLEGEQVEIGFKYQPTGLPFAFNAAVYELTEKNQIVQFDFLFDGVQGADVKVRGLELEAIGKVTPELKVIGSYTYTDATYEKFPELFLGGSGVSAYMEGKPVEGVPTHMASFWAIYSVLDGPLEGLSFGGGVRYLGESDSFALDVGTGQELHVRTPSTTLFDAMVAYETPDWRWQLTAQNLADEYYTTVCSAFRGDCGVGQARTIITGFTYKF